MQKNGRIDAAVDVFALGVIAWELVAGRGRRPYRTLDQHQVPAAVAGGLRPIFPPGLPVPATYRAMAERCWARNPRERPSAAEVVSFCQQQLWQLRAAASPPPAPPLPQQSPSTTGAAAAGPAPAAASDVGAGSGGSAEVAALAAAALPLVAGRAAGAGPGPGAGPAAPGGGAGMAQARPSGGVVPMGVAVWRGGVTAAQDS
ncbi:hypothetical protein HYH03_004305 [Edaphochlamys debaryana]|uniref:Protein kinase domain-containing protein n=1 Tax=Edaphochlamys debaryana TaxID=47281 RepID=A0A836C3D2_9CHLO|nr:hypothetical protein HYH03_004305 [Edaphochlamys debaryana]|eukprot:KAG2497559.1 hypothetical protein HYH03_004305 [Edaphochlamys debaryana]